MCNETQLSIVIIYTELLKSKGPYFPDSNWYHAIKPKLTQALQVLFLFLENFHLYYILVFTFSPIFRLLFISILLKLVNKDAKL